VCEDFAPAAEIVAAAMLLHTTLNHRLAWKKKENSLPGNAKRHSHTFSSWSARWSLQSRYTCSTLSGDKCGANASSHNCLEIA
jgi:hypothetical protein